MKKIDGKKSDLFASEPLDALGEKVNLEVNKPYAVRIAKKVYDMVLWPVKASRIVGEFEEVEPGVVELPEGAAFSLLDCPTMTERDAQTLARAIILTARHGAMQTQERFRPYVGWEPLQRIRPQGSNKRLIGFFEGNRFIMLLCAQKSPKKKFDQTLQKAWSLRSRYYENV